MAAPMRAWLIDTDRALRAEREALDCSRLPKAGRAIVVSTAMMESTIMSSIRVTPVAYRGCARMAGIRLQEGWLHAHAEPARRRWPFAATWCRKMSIAEAGMPHARVRLVLKAE